MSVEAGVGCGKAVWVMTRPSFVAYMTQTSSISWDLSMSANLFLSWAGMPSVAWRFSASAWSSVLVLLRRELRMSGILATSE